MTVPPPVPARKTVTCDGTIVQLKVKGALAFAEASTASTDQVCGPSLRLEYVIPARQAVKGAESSEHWNVTPASESINENVEVVV